MTFTAEGVGHKPVSLGGLKYDLLSFPKHVVSRRFYSRVYFSAPLPLAFLTRYKRSTRKRKVFSTVKY